VSLRQIIAQEISQRGPITFSRYMELCLYHPELGFYSRNAEPFGKAGDFYTASDVHAVFGRLMARQFEEMWRALGSPAQIEILELGPGRGLFAQDVLECCEKKFPEFFRALHYALAERSPALRGRLRDRLAKFLARRQASLAPEGDSENGGKGAASMVRDAVVAERALAPEIPILVFANELFDALPVEIISTRGALRISTEDHRFIETWASPSAEELKFLDQYGVHPEPGERIEVPLIAYRFMSQLAASVHAGFILAIDYGYTRQEQLAGRHRGTLMAYRRHSASSNPYQAPGEQDLTAHVNFTALAAAAENGMQVQPLLTQSQFLMGIGDTNQFADAFEDCRLPQERAKVALQLKHLVTPAGMGESFQVLLAGKGIAEQAWAALSGLSFTRTKS
jgi:SAM-dependent MidA family methyltransferase